MEDQSDSFTLLLRHSASLRWISSGAPQGQTPQKIIVWLQTVKLLFESLDDRRRSPMALVLHVIQYVFHFFGK